MAQRSGVFRMYEETSRGEWKGASRKKSRRFGENLSVSKIAKVT